MSKDTYKVSDLKKLEGLEGIRRRPGMYIGDTETNGLHHLVEEVVANSIDEVMAGYCDRISVVLNKDGSIAIEDNGRGIPVEIHPEHKISGVELVLCNLHAGGKFDNAVYKTAAGLHGVGAKAVNALSSKLVCEVYRNGGLHEQTFKFGKPKGKLKKVRDIKGKTGTRMTFAPDKGIFGETKLEYDRLAKRLKQLAFLNAGVEIYLSDHRGGEERTDKFKFKGGLKSYITELAEGNKLVHPDPIILVGEADNIVVEMALQFTRRSTQHVVAFVNNVHTTDGGTHVTGFLKGLSRTLNAFANEKNMLKKVKVSLSGDDWREGLYVIINLRVPDPQFESQTKVKLTNPSIQGIVESITNAALGRYCSKNSARVKDIVKKAIDSALIREAARIAREKARAQIKNESTSLPSKLYDCRTRDIEKRELFLVEGSSAAGSSAEGRDSSFQAILPLQGKILNVEKSTKDKILAHAELGALMDSIGTRAGERNFDINKVRYGKIIIMTDADVDGSHIRCLLLTFFFRQMIQLIEQGKLYIAHPPLYAIEHKGQKYYVRDDDEKAQLLKRLFANCPEGEIEALEREGKIRVQRFKGLGEMNPQQLWDTTMDPETRHMEQVKLADLVDADQVVTMLMGSNAESRRDYIITHAAEMEFLDI